MHYFQVHLLFQSGTMSTCDRLLGTKPILLVTESQALQTA